jgi:predicted NUDIX family NTP pyrophosphohydrolase
MTDTPTKTRLAAALREVAANASPWNAAEYEKLAARAETGEFDDFSDVHVCGPTVLYQECIARGFTKFAARVLDGEFDASRAESDAWANSPEGREAMKDFSPEDRAKLFGVYHG